MVVSVWDLQWVVACAAMIIPAPDLVGAVVRQACRRLCMAASCSRARSCRYECLLVAMVFPPAPSAVVRVPSRLCFGAVGTFLKVVT